MTKSIPLTQGKFALVDDEDFEEIEKYKWYYKEGYAVKNSKRTIFGRHQEYMHRIISKPLDHEEVDHIDGDGTNNTKCNLRNCTHSENMKNKKASYNNSSEYKGVHYYKRDKKWYAHISVDGKSTHIGVFDNPKDAALAYDRFAKEKYGIFAKLNFKE